MENPLPDWFPFIYQGAISPPLGKIKWRRTKLHRHTNNKPKQEASIQFTDSAGGVFLLVSLVFPAGWRAGHPCGLLRSRKVRPPARGRLGHTPASPKNSRITAINNKKNTSSTARAAPEAGAAAQAKNSCRSPAGTGGWDAVPRTKQLIKKKKLKK